MSDQSSIDRRRFLSVLGVSTGGGALALGGCSTDRVQKLVPYLVQSEDQIPGISTYYASSCAECSEGCGLHVRTREGRAVKLEGNPEHPINRGKLCSRGQASLQGLYNPGRIRAPMVRAANGGFQEITWDDAIARLAGKLTEAAGRVGVISGAPRGTFSDLLSEWTTVLGGRLVRYQSFDHEPLRAANQRLFGRAEIPALDFGRARYIVSFGADFLDSYPGSMENQRGFARSHGFEGRDVAKLVYAAPRLDLTGLNADEWLSVPPGTEAVLALAMANVVLAERGGEGSAVAAAVAAYTPRMASQETGLTVEVIERVAREFAAARPSLAVGGGIGGQHAGATELAAAVNILNYAAGNIGETVRFGADPDRGDGHAALEQLAQAMAGGELAVIVVHEANPVYTLPKAGGFADRFRKVPFKVSTSLYLDETAALCDLLLPEHHALERWDDLRPRAGVYSLMQPVMEPVFNTLATGDLLLQVSRKVGGPLARFNAPSYQEHLRSRWQALATELGQTGFDAFWREALQRGGVFQENVAPAAVSLSPANVQASYTKPAFEGQGEFVFLTYPHPMLHDGRGANKPWLLENADPVTKITWHSWVEVGPGTARRLDLRDGEILEVTSPHGTIEVPVYVYPGLRDDVVAVPLGLGHTEYGAFAQGRGVNALDLLGPPRGDFVTYLSTRVAVRKTGGYRKLASVAGVPRQLGRGIAEAIPLAAARRGLTVQQAYIEAGHGKHEVNTEQELEAVQGWAGEQQEAATSYGDYAGQEPQWGMAIDLAKCTGCQACVTACYAENNIPTVGEEEVLRGREMTWIRIERYWEGGEHPGEPVSARFVPMLCQHCANAPCEPVCPVYAAYHTADGLNGQVYNRCVGTRYCANNCPYKVRYFNWYKYNEKAWPEPLHLQLNPDVTVRARGVMEKCTFCIQRIRGAQNQARLEDRPLRDGEFTTACAQACPSEAIVFGNMQDPASRVARLRQDPRGYHVLEDLNVRPAITYLAKVLHSAEA
ncbi:MAG: 4Fe-4S dicluster domain-containing protein [Gemmatimonadales bacterium]|nr:4Fe-4S dicluster domain-containing protein [Gemmatimonadales bacterium]